MWDDAVYNLSPRWLEESGLPEQLNREIGPGAWSVFKKLTEAEVEQNLLPDWFLVSRDNLAEWTGLAPEALEKVLDELVARGYLEKRAVAARRETLRLRLPKRLPTPRDKKEIAERLKARGWHLANRHWRYLEPACLRKAERKVLHLYEQLFGAQINDRIASDLVALAATFEYPEIEQAFQEAKKSGARTLKWILGYLRRGAEDERVSKAGRRASRKKSARRASSNR